MEPISTDPASGTRDFLPAEAARRERVFATVREVFARHGFDPLDTPAFERIEVLTGKYGEEGDQLIFKILRRGEHEASGEADLALRYDLTVPLARVVARYGSQLPTPFKRYQLAPVWRADRPAKGRFREFLQCDVDIVGSDSLVADAETILAVTDVLATLGLTGFTVQLNSRQALRGLIEAYGIPEALETDALTALDKLDKIGVEGVTGELAGRGIPAAAVEMLGGDLAAGDRLEVMRARLGETERGRAGLAEVDTVLRLLGTDIAGGAVTFSPVLARGLSYYTGPVFEVVHAGLSATIAAGGRYDGLVGMFSGTDVPACGGSLGLERILLLLAGADAAAGPQVYVTVMDAATEADALGLATRLRAAGVRTDVHLTGGRLGKQLKKADQRGATLALLRGDEEAAAGTVTLKDLRTGEQVAVAEPDLITAVQTRLAAAP